MVYLFTVKTWMQYSDTENDIDLNIGILDNLSYESVIKIVETVSGMKKIDDIFTLKIFYSEFEMGVISQTEKPSYTLFEWYADDCSFNVDEYLKIKIEHLKSEFKSKMICNKICNKIFDQNNVSEDIENIVSMYF